jgi:YidC/Oxa1 family membrane protein insertase
VIAVVWWQAILNFLGSVLAALYRLIPNYGVAIILLTLLMRVVLLPLGIKQIRSMQAMQTIQPKIKAIQQKYKGRPDGKQKITEETMALYKEHGVNPLGGCLPVLLQFPLLIALYAVLRVPGGIRHIPHNPSTATVESPLNSRLYNDIRANKTTFLGANLLCSAQQAGHTVIVKDKNGQQDKVIPELKCGSGVGVRIPYYLFALAMIATTYYQQRQMQRASPPGASQQQQTLTKVMPLLFGVWGFIFPAGLVVYWTTTNLVQIAQQHFMLPRGPVEAAGGASPSSDGGRRPARPKPGQQRTRPSTGRQGDRPVKPVGREGRAAANPSEKEAQPPGNPKRPSGGSGGRNAGSRKKRRKR